MMVTWVRGLFKDVRGELDFDLADCMQTRFQGHIDATRIWTGEPDRDAHLRSADFFDVENHPRITFTGAFTERVGHARFRADAELTIRANKRSVPLDVSYLGEWASPFWEGEENRGTMRRIGSRHARESSATTSTSPGKTASPAGAWSSPTRLT